MSCYALLPLCVNSKVPIGQSNKPDKPLKENEQLMLITDLAVAALAITAGVLIILQVNGVINLGALSGLGSIGSQAAYIMLGVGAGIIAIDLVKLAIQQARHINRLHLLITEESTQTVEPVINTQSFSLTQQLQGAQAEAEKVSELQKQLSDLHAAQERAIAEATQPLQECISAMRKSYTHDVNAAVQAITQQLQETQAEAEKVSELQKQLSDLHAAQERAITEATQPLQERISAMRESYTHDVNAAIQAITQQLQGAQAEAEKVPELQKQLSDLHAAQERAITEATQPLQKRISAMEVSKKRDISTAVREAVQAVERQLKEAATKAARAAELDAQIQTLTRQLQEAQANVLSTQRAKEEADPNKEHSETQSHQQGHQIKRQREEDLLPQALPTERPSLTRSSLLLRQSELNNAREQPPEMPREARETILALAKTKAGRSKINGALKGFQEYLQTKEEALHALELGVDGESFETELNANLNDSLFEGDNLEDVGMEQSYMEPISEEIDLEDLNPKLQAYFTALSEWIKEVEKSDERIKRVKLAMEQLTKELIDAFQQQRKIATHNAIARTASSQQREARVRENEADELAERQKREIEATLIFELVGTHFDLRDLADLSQLGRVAKGQIQHELALTRINRSGEQKKRSIRGTILYLQQLQKELVTEADRLKGLDLREKHYEEINTHKEKAIQLKQYLDKIVSTCDRVRVEDLFNPKVI